MIETTELLPGVTLRCCRDRRFKQGCLSFQVVRQMRSGEAGRNALIPAVLLRGTVRHPDLRAVTQHLDNLYGAAVGTMVRRVGDYQTLGLYCSFIDDRFALPGDRVTAGMMEFLEELLLDSPLENGGFLPEFVEGEKKNLISTMESERNDKQVYAMGRLLRAMSGQDAFGLPRLGEPGDLADADPQSLCRHYRQCLRESPVEIFYVGSREAGEIAEMLAPLLSRLDRCYGNLPPQTPLRPGAGSDIVERMEVSQGKLCLGFTTPITSRSPEFPAMQLCSTVLGGGMTSKLFLNVREKRSLCYSIGAGYHSSKGVLTVSAGIDFDREQETREEILAQLDACRRGDITQEELDAAKQAILSGLRGVYDSPGSIENYHSTALLSGMGLTPEAYMAAIRAARLPQVVAAANTLQLHSTYFLRGGEPDGAN